MMKDLVYDLLCDETEDKSFFWYWQPPNGKKNGIVS